MALETYHHSNSNDNNVSPQQGQEPFCEPPMGLYEALGREVGIQVDCKNAAYGDSFIKSGQVMRIFYSQGIKPKQMDDLLAVVRIVDKLFRVATDNDPYGEDPWEDILGYVMLRIMQKRKEREKQCQSLTSPPSAEGLRSR